MKFSVLSYHNLTLAYYSYGSYFADTVYLNNVSGIGTVIKVGHVSCGSTFAGDIVVNALAGAGNIHFAVGVQHDGRIRIGSQGFLTGRLMLNGYTQLDDHLIDLDGMHANATAVFGPNLTTLGRVHSTTAKAEILANCVFNEAVEIAGLGVWTGAKFRGVTDLSIGSWLITGGNHFSDTTIISTTPSLSGFVLSAYVPDTFLAPTTFVLNGDHHFQLGGSVGNYFADKVTFYNHSNTTKGFIVGSAYTTSSAHFAGDIVMNVPSGSGPINMIHVDHDGHLLVGEEGFHTGKLTLNDYTHTLTDTLNLSALHTSANIGLLGGTDIAAVVQCTSGIPITVTNSILRGNTAIVAPNISVITNRFLAQTRLEKTGTGVDSNYGNGFYGATTIVNNSSTNADLRFSWLSASPDTFYSHLTIENYTTSVLHSTGIYKGNLTFAGDSLAQFQLAHGNTLRSVLDGSANQTLSVAPHLNVQFFGLDVNKPSGHLTLSGTVDVQEDLALQNGIVYSENANLVLRDNATVTGVSDSSHVQGPIAKVGNDAFVFPVGRNGRYRPIAISAPSSGSAEFRGEYLNLNANAQFPVTSKDSTLISVSTNEYWNLDRLASSNTVNVTLSWKDMSCAVDTLSHIRIAAWDTTGAGKWKNLGNGSTTGTTASGTVVTGTAATVYGAFTLASVDTMVCVPCRADAGEDKICWVGSSTEIGGVNANENSFIWVPSTGLSSDNMVNVVATPEHAETYMLIATNPNGCEAKDLVNVSVEVARYWYGESLYRDKLYKEVVEQAEGYFSTTENFSNYEMKYYQRFRSFWWNRVFGNEDLPHGSFLHATRAAGETFLNEDRCTYDAGVNAEWEFKGPHEIPTSPTSGGNTKRGLGIVATVNVDSQSPDNVLIGTTAGGLWKTTDRGLNWENISDNSTIMGMMGIQHIEIDPNDNNRLFATCGKGRYGSTYGIGILRSDDGGESWVASGNLTYDPSTTQRFSKVVIDPSSTNNMVLYATGRTHIWKSTDGGDSWTSIFGLDSDDNGWFSDIKFHPTNHSIVYVTKDAAGAGAYGPCYPGLGARVFRTTNAGASFVDITPSDIQPVPDQSPSHWCDSQDSNSSYDDVDFKSSDKYAIAVSAANPNSLYLTYRNFHFNWNNSNDDKLHVMRYEYNPMTETGAWVSDNITIASTASPGYWTTSFDISPTDPDVMYFGGIRPYKTTDGGATVNSISSGSWISSSTTYIHDDIRSIKVAQGSDPQAHGADDEVWMANDGGISYSSDGGSTWEYRNNGLQITEFFGFDVSEGNSLVAGGAFDNATFTYRISEDDWHTPSSAGDHYSQLVAPDESTIYSCTGNGLQSSNALGHRIGHTGGASSIHSYGTNVNGGPQPFPSNAAITRDQGNNIYLGRFDLLKLETDEGTYNSQNSFTPISDFASMDDFDWVTPTTERDQLYSIGAIGISPSNANYIYISFARVDLNNDKRIMYRTVNGGLAWTRVDFPENLSENPTRHVPINEVEVDPINPHRIFVAFGGFRTGTKVYTIDLSAESPIWQNMSDGLPNWPVNDLVYQNGTDDILYAATDLGVYRWDKTQSRWECYGEGLPAAVIPELRINYCAGKLWAVSFGRGLYMTDLHIPEVSVPKIVSQAETWEQTIRLASDLIIQPGAHLTIKAQVNIPEGHKIVVKPGAKLTVDGGTLTNTCGNNWLGVVVEGTPNAAPSTNIGGPQGYVLLKNGAVIEHAKVGVSAVDGGILRSYGTGTDNRVTFRNCRKGVELKPYNYTGLLTGSRLHNTDFICDAPMNDPSYVSNGQRIGVNSFVSAWLHDKVTISGCTFTNTLAEGTGALYKHLRGIGIVAIDTKVDATSNEFTGLSRGIDVQRSFVSPTRLKAIDNDFDNTMQGILSEGSQFDEMRENTFYIPARQTTGLVPDWDAWGIYMRNGGNHTLEHNDLNTVGETMTDCRGIVNRGQSFFASGGMVRHNTFANIYVGTQTELHNTHLQLLCNTYDTTMGIDWAINPQSQNMVLGPQGTSCNAFSPSDYRAGNQFYNTNDDHIYSWAQEFMYYASGTTNTVPDVSSAASNADVDDCELEETSCPTTEPSEAGELLQMRLLMDSTISALDGEKILVTALLDSGLTKTDTLLAHIEDSTYSNALLASELANWSMLSDTVLLAVHNRYPVFSINQYVNVMMSNLPVSRPVWQAVAATFGDIKVETADSLRKAQASDANRTLTVIDREKAVAESARFRAVNDYIEIFLDRDSIVDSTYTAINYMLSVGDKAFYKLAVGTTLGLDTLEWSRNLLDSLDLVNEEDSAFYQLHDLAITLAEDTLTWFGMDTIQYAKIYALSEGATTMKGYAEAVLALLSDSAITRTPEPLPELPSERRGQEEESEMEQRNEYSQAQITVYPNPFNGSFTISYNLPKEAQEIKFEVFDLAGRRIRDSLVRNSQQGKHTIDLSPCGGFYMIRVSADNVQVLSDKLICIQR